MEYAVIRTGGKQYLVESDMPLEVGKLDNEVGDKVTFSEVLLYVKDGEVELGTPYCNKAVQATVEKHFKDKKKVGMKYQPGGYRKKFGHRQQKTLVQIRGIIDK